MSGSGSSKFSTPEGRLRESGIHLPLPPKPLGVYVPAVQTGNLLFLSGMLPMAGHEPKVLGRLGKEIDIEAGRDAARIAALNALAVVRQHLGSLDRVTRVVRLGVSIATWGDFAEHVKVADSASELFRDIFGADRMSTRLIIGLASLPLGVPIALESIFEIEG
jgi:enamine deaminase RidA (YjgF/YER057c/UK114 family)